MSRTPLWSAIADTLRRAIAAGEYKVGDKLQTEAALSARFGVNRHTVRHALKVLAEEGLVHSRRGAGVFVAMAPTDYPLGRRVRFNQNLAASGREARRQVLSLLTRPASEREGEALSLAQGERVHVYEGISLADGTPIAVFNSVFPAARFPDMLRDLEETTSISKALARAGVPDYVRSSTRLTAKLASATQALHLQIAENAPLLRSVSVNSDPDGRAVEYGRTWFAGDRGM